MRKYLLIILFFFNQVADAQVMISSFQAVQTRAISLPAISTTQVTSVNSTSGVSGGHISNDGGTPITSKGICWDTSPNPTIASVTKTNDGSGLGSFGSNLTGLTSGTVYYVRAYAVNSFGTSYGAQFTFIALAIGDTYQGGKLAYLIASGDPGYDVNTPHGLIAHNTDLANARWGTEGLNVAGAGGTAIGTGYQNTLDIIAGDALGVAATNCRALTTNGYNDWYMPSKDELNKLYLNRLLIGGFTTGWYFSSTESTSVYGWFQDFSNGAQAGTGAHKDWALSLRAIRAF
jgi:hypothetical protein